MDETLEQLKKMSTSTLGDTLDQLGIAGHCFASRPELPALRAGLHDAHPSGSRGRRHGGRLHR